MVAAGKTPYPVRGMFVYKQNPMLAVPDTAKTADVFAKAKRNGDGVVPADTVDDEKARGVAENVIACLGGLPDRSGKVGYDQARLDAFCAAAAVVGTGIAASPTEVRDPLSFAAMLV